ncbi:MAG: endolytic transglycosylase MltG [Actinomycetota bacterium]|nr:endolytic transglycosylase MltG [Actinomycetota bacterium]
MTDEHPPVSTYEEPPLDVDWPPRTRRRGLVKLVAFFAVILLLLGGGALYVAGQTTGSSEGKPVKVTIPQGATATSIAKQLGDAGVIRSSWLFRLLARLRGTAADLKPGEYDLRTGMSYSAVFTLLEKGPTIPFVRITIPEGSALGQIIRIARAKLGLPAKAFDVAIGRAQRPVIAGKNRSLEGLLYPDTYFFKKDATAEDVIKRLLGTFEERTADLDFTVAGTHHITPYQSLVLASLVEREALVDADRPLIASVIYNRLQRGMHLEIDATVQYAIYLKTGKVPTNITPEDLHIRSPYNTYQIDGLPPTPIASSGLKSINAALNPATTKYLYYVLSADGKKHCFATTYNEFLAYNNRTRSCA